MVSLNNHKNKYLSIDLESFVHINPNDLSSSEDRKRKDDNYIVQAVETILTMLKETKNKATFFVLGEIYEWYPEIIDKIKKEGHEIGYHSHTHRIIKNAEIMKEEIEKSKKFIEKFKPFGFRAPQMFLTKDSLEVLKKSGFSYDSSVYGNKPFKSILLEIPVTTLINVDQSYPQPLSLKNLFKFPVGSGFFFGLFGSKIAKKDLFMFVHPWQIVNFPFKYKFKACLSDPRVIPYMINRKNSFEKLLRNNRFFVFSDFFISFSSNKKSN